jgi:DNA repair photolyase
MPGINDDPEQVREILRLCREAGAAYVTGIALHLRGEVRQVFMEWLRETRPDLVDRYRALYRRGAYAPVAERKRLSALLQGPDLSPWERARGTRRRPAEPLRAAGAPEQERLFDA